MLLLASLLLAACQDEAVEEAPFPPGYDTGAEPVVRDAGPVQLLADPAPMPTSQPDDSPLTATYCREIATDDFAPFGNHKGCVQQACQLGDAEACTAAATYNCGIYPEDDLPDYCE